MRTFKTCFVILFALALPVQSFGATGCESPTHIFSRAGTGGVGSGVNPHGAVCSADSLSPGSTNLNATDWRYLMPGATQVSVAHYNDSPAPATVELDGLGFNNESFQLKQLPMKQGGIGYVMDWADIPDPVAGGTIHAKLMSTDGLVIGSVTYKTLR